MLNTNISNIIKKKELYNIISFLISYSYLFKLSAKFFNFIYLNFAYVKVYKKLYQIKVSKNILFYIKYKFKFIFYFYPIKLNILSFY